MTRTQNFTDGKLVAEVTETTIGHWNTDYNVKLYQDGWEVANLNYATLDEANEVACDWHQTH